VNLLVADVVGPSSSSPDSSDYGACVSKAAELKNKTLQMLIALVAGQEIILSQNAARFLNIMMVHE
jgi:hypothetical protein